MDPTVLARTLPGCERLERLDEKGKLIGWRCHVGVAEHDDVGLSVQDSGPHGRALATVRDGEHAKGGAGCRAARHRGVSESAGLFFGDQHDIGKGRPQPGGNQGIGGLVGLVADRMSKRRLLMLTQGWMGMVSLLLGALVAAGCGSDDGDGHRRRRASTGGSGPHHGLRAVPDGGRASGCQIGRAHV